MNSADTRVVNPWVVAGAVMLATFMEVLDTTVVNVSLPHIAGNLSSTIDESTWTLTAYLVANAIVLPLSGWFSTLFGRKRFYITCVILFTVSSALCGLAPSLSAHLLVWALQTPLSQTAAAISAVHFESCSPSEGSPPPEPTRATQLSVLASQ